MFDAGSAVYTLTGHVVRAPFEDYGRLIENAKRNKEHSVTLTADPKPAQTGFDRFKAGLEEIKVKATEVAGAARESFSSISRSSNEASTATDSNLTRMRTALDRTAQRFRAMAAASSESAKVVEDSNARMAASSGGGRGGSGVIPVARGPGGESPEQQARKTTAAWKDGFNTLANLGKWVTAGIVGVGVISVKAAGDFERQMLLVQTQAGYSAKQVDALKKSVLDLAPAVGFGPTKLAEALFHVASSGIPASKAMEVLKIAAEGAKVGNADLEDVTNALVAIMKTAPHDIHSVGEAMGLMTDAVGKGNLRMQDLTAAITTGVLPAAKAVGLGFRDVAAAIDVMTARGIPAQEGSTRLRTVLGLIANPTTKAQKALDLLGFSHNRLADDFRKHGLVFALEDLQTAMQHTFGRPLNDQQMRQVLTNYAKQLADAGASTKTIEQDVKAYHEELLRTGDGAVKSSQLIADAFGGARMGTTMQILMQNIGDVRKHFNELNTDNAAGKFQSAWQVTQKDFDVQVSQMWAGVQRLGIIMGEFLIPKLRDMVKWLIQASHWLHEHKAIGEALAITFGTVLTAAVVAFFARFLAHIAGGIANIGRFGASIGRLPGAVERATAKINESLSAQKRALQEVADQAGLTAEALGGEGDAAVAGVTGHGGRGGGVAEALGSVEGLITGVHGTTAPGSAENPLAVVVMASEAFGLGARGAASESMSASSIASEEKTAASRLEKTGGGVILPRGVSDTRGAAAAATAEEAIAAESAGSVGLLASLKSGAGSIAGAGGRVLSGAMRGAGIFGIGALGSQLVGSAVGGQTGATITQAGTFAAAGAGLGSMIAPGIGTAIGGALGAGVGLAIKFVHDHSYGKEIADSLTRGFGGAAAENLKKNVSSALDDAHKLLETSRTSIIRGGGRFPQSINIPVQLQIDQLSPAKQAQYHADMKRAGNDIASQLEKGWNSFKFQDEPTMFKQLRSEIKKLPPEAQAYAIQSAIHFSSGLESQGRLVKGSSDQLVMDAQKAFPGFEKYLALTGADSAKAFEKNFNFDKTNRNTLRSLNQIAGHFSVVTDALDGTAQDASTRSAAMIKVLQNIAKNGTGPMRKQAAADIKALQNNMKTYFSAMADDTAAKTASMKDAIVKGSADAATKAEHNYSSFVSSVQTAMKNGSLVTSEGMRLIADTTNQVIKTFGGHPIPIPALIRQQQLSQIVASGRTGPGVLLHEAGGMLPGSEFGLGDVMTLVDPMGRPRARMAGDEAVFNRHQMPYVEAGLQAIGLNGAEDLWSRVSKPHSHERGGKLRAAVRNFAGGGYIYPLPKDARLSRTDQGVDATMTPGESIGPMARSRVVGIQPNWYQGQPFMWWQLLEGPRAGRYAFVAEQIVPEARPGQIVNANQAVARYASSGTGIEYGWATSTGATLARATTGYTEGEVTPAGRDMRSFLQGLSHGLISGGGALGDASVWQNLRVPKVSGRGVIADVDRGMLRLATDAANAYGQRMSGSISGAGWTGGGNARANEALGRRMMTAMGWGADQWPALLALWTQESGWNQHATNPSSGAYGIPQALPANKLASAGGDWRTNPATQIAWGLNYIRQRYGSPAAAEAHERSNNWYAGGGWLPGFQRGRHLTHATRRRTNTGGSRSLRTPRATTHKKPPSQRGRPKQTLSQTTANTLKSLGFGNFTADQNKLGTLDNQYSQQEALFNLFSPEGLSQDELNTLMGIREQEWDILFHEHQTLPAAIAAMQRNVDALAGKTKAGHWKYGGNPRLFGMGALSGAPALTGGHAGAPIGSRTWVGPQQIGGIVPLLTKEVSSTEDEITKLRHDLQLNSRSSATVRHNISGHIMDLADGYARRTADLTSRLDSVNEQKYQDSRARITLQNRIRNLPSSRSSSSTLSVNQIVSGVLAGTLPSTGPVGGGSNPTKKRLQDQISALHAKDLHLTNVVERGIRAQLHTVSQQHAAAVRQYRRQGFDEAWTLTLDKWRIQDKIYRLQQTLKKLKDSLKEETKAEKADQNALQTLKDWQSGGLQGSQSIDESLESTAFNMLDLHQQGANLPTPGRQEPTLKNIENFLTSMGLQLPPGLTQGTATATAQQAFADFQTFQQSRAALFSQFGSNFVGAGVSPFGTAPGVAAGTQYFGAAAGNAAGLGAPGGVAGSGQFAQGGYLASGNNSGKGDTKIEINNHFAAGPPDPHTWSAGTVHELTAMA